jgi:Tfp pilus assembly protein PilN
MKVNINLVSTTVEESVKEQRSLRILRYLAISAVALIGLSSVISFIITQQVSPSGVIKQQVQVLSEIAALREKEAKILLVNSRVSDINSIIEKREKYDQVLSTIFDSIPAGLSVDTIQVSSNSIGFSAGSSSLLIIEDLINSFSTLVAEKRLIKKLTIGNITADSNSGAYNISISAERL